MTPEAYHARDCTVVTLPDTIAVRVAERLSTEDILAVKDEDCGGFLFFEHWEKRDDWYEVGERLRCFTMAEEEEIQALVLAAREAKGVNVAAVIDAADDRNETARREAIRTGKVRVKHSENRGGFARARRLQ